MDISLKKQLEGAGYVGEFNLSSLIEACKSKDLFILLETGRGWIASTYKEHDDMTYKFLKLDGYNSPEEAVAMLWLELNKKR